MILVGKEFLGWIFRFCGAKLSGLGMLGTILQSEAEKRTDFPILRSEAEWVATAEYVVESRPAFRV
jgi:hypothetical protein